jgi:hypothetical protein
LVSTPGVQLRALVSACGLHIDTTTLTRASCRSTLRSRVRLDEYQTSVGFRCGGGTAPTARDTRGTQPQIRLAISATHSLLIDLFFTEGANAAMTWVCRRQLRMAIPTKHSGSLDCLLAKGTLPEILIVGLSVSGCHFDPLSGRAGLRCSILRRAERPITEEATLGRRTRLAPIPFTGLTARKMARRPRSPATTFVTADYRKSIVVGDWPISLVGAG